MRPIEQMLRQLESRKTTVQTLVRLHDEGTHAPSDP
jgi:hypothetical protein